MESSRQRVITVPFLMAIAMLAAAAFLCGPFASWMDLKSQKQGISLRLPLASLDERALAPYKVVRRNVLDPIMVEALGTDMYLSWQLEDENRSANDPLRVASLLVTYDTGGRSLVPHTPDVCWLGAGYEKAQPHENVDLELGGFPVDGASRHAGRRTVPVRVCTFAKTSLRNRAKQTVVYTFNCNGQFVATRNWVRTLINTPTNRYAYFSKVEITFPGATRAEAVRGAGILFERLLPALVGGHWPDFEAAERAAREGD